MCGPSDTPEVAEMFTGSVKVVPESIEVDRNNSLLEGEASSTHRTRNIPEKTDISGWVEGVSVLERFLNPEKLPPPSEDLAYMISLLPEVCSSHTAWTFMLPSNAAMGSSESPGKLDEIFWTGDAPGSLIRLI